MFARCEEGLWFATPEDYCNRKTGRDAFAVVDGFLAWGREHAHALAQVYPQFSHKVVATGNVRCDLMSPAVRGIYEREVSEIRKQWGEFVLLNTKLAKVNNVRRGVDVVERHIIMGHAPTEEQVRLTTKRVALEKAVLPHVVEFVERFSKQFPGEQLIHSSPSGGRLFVLEGYRGRAKRMSTSFIRATSIRGCWPASFRFRAIARPRSRHTCWINQASTSGQSRDDEVEWELPMVTAYQVESTDALLRVLALSDPRSALSLPNALAAEFVGRYIAQCGGTLASQAILDYFADLHRPREGRDQPGYNLLGKVNLGFVALQRLKVFVAWCISKHNRGRNRNRAHKFPGLDYSQIAARVDDICRTLGYEGVRVKKLAKKHPLHRPEFVEASRTRPMAQRLARMRRRLVKLSRILQKKGSIPRHRLVPVERDGVRIVGTNPRSRSLDRDARCGAEDSARRGTNHPWFTHQRGPTGDYLWWRMRCPQAVFPGTPGEARRHRRDRGLGSLQRARLSRGRSA